MAKLLRLRRGTDTQHTTFTGAEGEVTVNTTNDSLHVHDGTTAGGRELARADLSNVSGTTEGGITVNGNLSLADSNKARFGTGNDLEIYHDGSNSHIADAGTGNLLIRGQEVQIGNAAGSRILLQTNSDAASVTLYNDTTARLTTTNTGIDVTGSVTTDGLTSTGSNTLENTDEPQLILRDTDSSGVAARVQLEARGSDNAVDWFVGHTSTSNGSVTFMNEDSQPIYFGVGGSNRFELSSSGHLVPQTTNTYDLGTSSNQWRDGYFDGTVYCDGFDCDGAAHIQVDSAGDATPLTVYNGTSGGNTRLLISSYPNGSGDPFIKFDAGGTDMAVGLFWESGANKLRLGPGASPASTTGMQIDASGHCLPTANNSLDLGNASLRWRNVYTNDLNLSNEGGTNDVDGTWGSWTIQEGEDDLFLLNRRNGKKYKFNLSEVN